MCSSVRLMSIDPEQVALRKGVEALVNLLHRRVLQNDALLRRLEEREQTIAQVEATIGLLRAELARRSISPGRVAGIARTVVDVLGTAVIGAFAAVIDQWERLDLESARTDQTGDATGMCKENLGAQADETP